MTEAAHGDMKNGWRTSCAIVCARIKIALGHELCQEMFSAPAEGFHLELA
jgi:hypothetical protein